MERPNFFLRTKLLPPRHVPEILARPRLTSILQANVNAPVTLVTADAGCGKTTLVAEFLRQQPRQTVWYQLDHTDADPFVFLGYICHGIKRFAPDFGETLLPYLSEATDDLLTHPERAVDLLLNEILESIEQPFILILDDYHHIGRETIVHRLVDRLLQYSSDMLHLIITTRDLPPLAIMRRRSQATATVISREDLLFTDEEVRELFRTTLNIELKSEEIAEYRERTHGWITALQLVRQVAEQETRSQSEAINLPNLREMLKQSEKDIFDYFAEEVFAREEEETQNLLLHLSLLDSLPLEVCSSLFPKMRCAAELPELVKKNIFLTVAGESYSGEEYRLHPLFREFLLRRFRTEIGRADLATERVRIAEFFLSKQLWEKALPYLLEAEEFERAAQTIAEYGEKWLASGAITTLGIFSEKIPSEFLDKFPRSLLHTAEVARLQGETEMSSSLLGRAVKLLNQQKDSEGEAEALHSLASIERRKGDCETALDLLERAEKLAGGDSEVRMKCENTRGLCLIENGAWTEAERQFRLALQLAEKHNNERYIRLITHNLALPFGLRGDFGEALRWLKRIFREDKPEAQLPQESIGHLNIARLHLYRGEFAETETHLGKALELCQLYNLKHLRGEIFESYANFYREKRDFTHAAEFYERARKAYEEDGVDPSNREFDEERAALAQMRGDTVTARNLLENLLEIRQENKNEIGLHTVKLGLCRIKLEQNEIAGLAAELEKILRFFHEKNLYYYEAAAAVLQASALFAEGKRKEMMPPIQRALELAARFDYEYFLREETKRNPALFGNEEIIEKLPLDLRESINQTIKAERVTLKPKKPDSVQRSAFSVQTSESAPVVDLTLKLLGHVEIYRDPTKQFAPDAWTTRRARDIFCFIATSRHRRVDKDVLIDTFWADSEIEVVEKNFHPTISHVRKALNSRQTIKQNFILYRDGAYQLNSELTYSIDTEEFSRFIAEAEKANHEKDSDRVWENVEAAHRLYRGDFMAGIYEDWAEELRGFYREQHSRILKSMTKFAFKEKNWVQALHYSAEILRDDPYREDIHALIMRVYAAQGKRSAVKDQYQKLQKILKTELGVEPAVATKRIFQELFK
ncbi:MAG: tetratricopeptide repeat protein [Acidobacteria bacterium]|jgi:ATP/maltotriose-dependent transcriptional regulator MalT/DNA-binding SARP family transcriptional activator|nr:tetratricopeptide repeat protein [Acidobacteriota bacterium]